MVVDMELQEAKDAVLQLIKDKEKIESTLQALKELLDSNILQNQIDMDESLVDSEGYPRQDIDVYQGIQVEDLILEFGSIHYRNFKSLTDIGKLVENSRYKVINLKIKRGSNVIVLSLTPRPWVGKGLLGCNVIPLEIVER
ncbi:26S proteasome non-ATPase regulatory subunit 9 [Camponotus floridanus]|uniref:26S proteasome non-ATPase regulatory subunit 9 n=1 Tax=Camponotus floridanus TaxID=104421 RepID=E1ZVH9_CAMFO|nr:26S proteasome non-ATPase regulatory subunit 9 [Camponotus floridanus]